MTGAAADRAIRSAAWIIASAAVFAGTPVLACDKHDTADNQFLAYIDFRGMNEAEMRAAERAAIDKYHDQQIAFARARFLRRFEPDPEPVVREAQASPAATASSPL